MGLQLRRFPIGLAAVVAFSCLAGGVPGAEAQYFGRNKVQYRSFDFQVLGTEHFDVYFYEEEREAATHAARMAERWYARLSRLLDADLRGRQPLILYASHPHFEQTNAIPGRIGEATGGVTEPLKRRVVLPMAGPLSETDHVVGHELVHAFQFSLSGVDPDSPMYRVPGALRLPLWMIEGMAEYLSVGPSSAQTAMWMRDALREDDLPSISDLGDPRRYFPYRYGHALWAWVAGQHGDRAVADAYRAAAGSGSAGSALSVVLDAPVDSLTRRWHEALREAYAAVRGRTDSAGAFGEAIVTRESSGGATNVGASISPDGERMIFLSERSMFAMEMYLADAETGEVIRRITRTAVDPHYQSLQFLNSAGAWSPDGRRFAFAAVSDGTPVLAVLDVESGDREREIGLPRFGEIFNPTWSPGGDRIAFAANQGGLLDLWVVDVSSGDLRRLTDDPFAELHPDWSPDGRLIAFATDRFGADMGRLEYGSFRLATIDPESREVAELSGFEGSKHISPQWGAHGEDLYFVSDRGGISNVYRLDTASGQVRRVTDVYTGVSGITELSPSLSVASGTGSVVFSAFRNGGYDIYRADSADVLAGRRPEEPAADPSAADLPPRDRSRAEVAELLDDPELGLPSPVTFESAEYDPSLGLDYVSQPSLAFGASSYGTFVSGGASFHFSDMLGFHSLSALLQVRGQGDDVLQGTGALAGYENRKGRTNWRLLGGQVPEISRGYRQGYADLDGDGDDEYVREVVQFWKVDRRVVGSLQYPFSPVHRLELSAGVERIDFQLETDRLGFDRSGEKVLDRTVEAPACGDSLSFRQSFCEPPSMNELTGSAALVYDNSIGGPTGPILGQRYRFEVAPSVGTLDYAAATLDFRRYMMPLRPVTLAGRVLHFGRWGAGADDDRLRRLYAGSPWLIRGYDLRSFDIRSCPPDRPLADCSEVETFDRLLGTRMAVGNAELRLPLFGPLGVLSRGGYLPPLELVGFFDAGMAWASRDPDSPGSEQAFFLGGDREPVTSAGVGLRMNLLGFAVGEVDWVTPFDRPERGSYFTFSLVPGF